MIWKVTRLLLVLLTVTAAAGFGQTAHDQIPYDELPRLGSADAPVKVVEFADFKCPHCKTFAEQIVPLMRNEFIRAGIASLYFMNFPVISGDSVTAGAAAAAVHDIYGNEAFWEFEKALFENQATPGKRGRHRSFLRPWRLRSLRAPMRRLCWRQSRPEIMSMWSVATFRLARSWGSGQHRGSLSATPRSATAATTRESAG